MSKPNPRRKGVAAEKIRICPCGYWEPVPADSEADLEDRPRMPGF